jgi:hypothetical protein
VKDFPDSALPSQDRFLMDADHELGAIFRQNTVQVNIFGKSFTDAKALVPDTGTKKTHSA